MRNNGIFHILTFVILTKRLQTTSLVINNRPHRLLVLEKLHMCSLTTLCMYLSIFIIKNLICPVALEKMFEILKNE